MSKYIMLQGTSSNVGKSIVTAALCRIFKEDGYSVAPFKAQNMALNSFVTKDGKEMGNAQAVQAEAACIEAGVEMNPILLKPTGNKTSQVIVMGKSIGTMSAKDYHESYAKKAFPIVKNALKTLEDHYEIIVIEGAGSPAEVNLKDNDIVNMAVAKHLNAPVFLIADIDRGGALASLVGTLELLDEEERKLVKGLIINKFRGDLDILKPALIFLYKKTGIPVLGVLNYIENLKIDDEDSVALEEKSIVLEKDIRIAVIRLPKITNFTDFATLETEPGVSVAYIKNKYDFNKFNPDLIIIPDSENAVEDLVFLKDSGLEKEIIQKHKKNTPIIGIGSGYQMLGQKIINNNEELSNIKEVAALSLLSFETILDKNIESTQVFFETENLSFLNINETAKNLNGYKISQGKIKFSEDNKAAFKLNTYDLEEGVIGNNNLILGTSINGIFSNDNLRFLIINKLKEIKGFEQSKEVINIKECRENEYQRLAQQVRKELDMRSVYNIVGLD